MTKRKNKKLIVATLLAVPAAVVVGTAGVQAADVTAIKELASFNIHNEFVTSSNVTTQASTKDLTAATDAELARKIIAEMKSLNKGFTVTYDVDTADNYKVVIEKVFNDLKSKINTVEVIGTETIDYTVLYGLFKNARVDATEIKTTTTVENQPDKVVTKVKLKFSINYFVDATQRTAYESGITSIKNNIFTTGMTDVQKASAVNEYIVKKSQLLHSNHSISKLVLDGEGSAHAYSLLAYQLLKGESPTMDAKYVSGLAGGNQHSWNLVKIGSDWYHLDTVWNDDTLPKTSKYISYQYFLATNESLPGRVIQVGASEITQWGTAYKVFENVINPAQGDGKLYFADAEFGGKIRVLDLAGTTISASDLVLPTTPPSTSGYGEIVYYQFNKPDPDDTTKSIIQKDLYFINHSQASYLYKYDLLSPSPNLILVDNVSVSSLKIEGRKLIYKLANGTTKDFYLDELEDFNASVSAEVIKLINALGTHNDTVAFRTKVMEAREKYNQLTTDQKAILGIDPAPSDSNSKKPLEILEDAEAYLVNAIGNTTRIAEVILAINTLDKLNTNYYNSVQAAWTLYTDLTETNQNKIYNFNILKVAHDEILVAKKLNDDMRSLFNLDEPFKNSATFIADLENVARRYDNLLPSLQSALEPIVLSYLNTYRSEAIGLKAEVKNLQNKIAIIDADDKKYIELMEEINEEFEKVSKTISQLTLLSSTEKSKVTINKSTATLLKKAVADFAEAMDKVISDLVETPPVIKDTTVAEFNKAKNLYTSFNNTQLYELSKLTGSYVVEYNKAKAEIEGLEVATLDFREAFNKLTLSNYDKTEAGFTKFKDAVDLTIQKLGDLSTDAQLTVSLLKDEFDEIKSNLAEIDTPVGQGKIDSLKNKIAGLTESSSVEDVEAVIVETDAFATENPVAYYFFIEVEKLQEVKDKLLLKARQKTALDFDNKVIVLKAKKERTLIEITALLAEYTKLELDIQELVEQYETLLSLKAEFEADVEATEKMAKEVSILIDKLGLKPTKDKVEAARKAYDGLSTAGKALVTNLAKLVEAEAYIKKQEDEATEKAADEKARAEAREVEIKINAISETSTLEEVKAANAAYTALSNTAKTFVSASAKTKLVRLLEAKETEYKETHGKAQAEAKVVSDRINKITTATTVKELESIRRAYEALSELAKTYVKNLSKLTSSEVYQEQQAKIVAAAKNQASAFDTYMADLNRNSTTAEIAKARAFYNNLSAEAKKHVKTHEKLVKLETMWSDPDYIDLYLNYYPHYTDQQPAGGIEITAPKPDPLFIPDSVATTNAGPGEIAMDYRDGNYTATVFATDAPGSTKSKLTLTSSNNVKVSLPKKDILALKKLPVTVSTAVGFKSVTISFTEGYTAKTFSDFVEIKVPVSELGANSKSVILCKLPNGRYEKATYQVLDGAFVIKTKVGATFVVEDKSSTTTTTSSTGGYKDINSNANNKYINELAKLGIVSGGTASNYYPSQNITRGDFAIMIARAAKLTTSTTTSLTDVRNTANASLIEALNESGIMRGTTSTRFNMSGTVTREEASVILARLFRHLKMDVATMQNEQQTNYRDIANLSYESRRSIALMNLLEIFDDGSATAFKPTAKLTRGEFAKVLSKAMEAAELK